MMNFSRYSFPLLLLAILGIEMNTNAQERKTLVARVIADSTEKAEVSVLNLQSRKGTVTKINELFKISGRAGDTLFVSSLAFEPKQVPVTEKILKEQVVRIKLTDKVFNLREVQLSNTGLTGFLSLDAQSVETDERADLSHLSGAFGFYEHRTPEERRIYTATGADRRGLSLDRVLNQWSGRLAMLKRQLGYSHQKKLVGKGKEMVPPDFFQEELELSPDYTDDFIYFCLRSKAFRSHLQNYDEFKVLEFYKENIANYWAHREG